MALLSPDCFSVQLRFRYSRTIGLIIHWEIIKAGLQRVCLRHFLMYNVYCLDMCVDNYRWNLADYIKLTLGPLQHTKVFSCFLKQCAGLADHSKHCVATCKQDEVAQSVLGGFIESV